MDKHILCVPFDDGFSFSLAPATAKYASVVRRITKNSPNVLPACQSEIQQVSPPFNFGTIKWSGSLLCLSNSLDPAQMGMVTRHLL